MTHSGRILSRKGIEDWFIVGQKDKEAQERERIGVENELVCTCEVTMYLSDYLFDYV